MAFHLQSNGVFGGGGGGVKKLIFDCLFTQVTSPSTGLA